MDTSKCNQIHVEEDGWIWDDGFITFEQDMKTDEDLTFELLKVDIPSRGTSVNVLQILVL